MWQAFSVISQLQGRISATAVLTPSCASIDRYSSMV